MKFVADTMLGSLARWLRLLGYDVLYPKNAPDADLVKLAAGEGRILLTRDAGIPKRRDSKQIKIVVLKNTGTQEQLAEVVAALSLAPDRSQFFTRCPECNGTVVAIDRESARGNVPGGVLSEQDKFWRCPSCGKFYWEGSHHTKIRRVFDSLGK